MLQTQRKKLYTAFGLTVLSDISLPELQQLIGYESREDISIVTKDLTSLWKEMALKTSKFVVKENFILFKINNTAIFCIENGNKITVSPIKGAEFNKIRLYILGTCMGALLLQRRILPLHGSAVAINGKAYAFIGQSGAGKSTLASVFLENGFQLLSDDVIPVISLQNGIPHVIPSYPQQKLWKESLDEFGMAANEYSPLFERETKYAIPVNESFCRETLPLGGVFELVKSPSNEIKLISFSILEQLHTLYNHTYRNFLINRLGIRDWHFKSTVYIAEKIQFYQLQRPDNQFTAFDLRSLVLSTINQEVKV
jgi:energy-coupling factor transporter ATP-binding protein EcfA2